MIAEPLAPGRTFLVGAAVERTEDEHLLRGQGRFTDDIAVPECLHAAFLRSPFGHARIRSIDASAARAHPGVHAVYTAADLGAANRPFPLPTPHPTLRPKTPVPLAVEKTRYVGEPVAMIVADDRYIAEDALDMIEVDYDPIEATPGLEEALAGGTCVVHDDLGDNVAAVFSQTYGDLDDAFARAAVVVRERFVCDRGSGQPMETRAVLAIPSDADGLIVYDTTQTPHVARRLIATILDLPEDRVRVIAPDVGGGFGPKAVFYPEEVVVPFAARALKRPVKWVEDRLEHFRATAHERTQIHDVEAAAAADGTLLGLRVNMVHDTGAYVPWGIIVPFITIATVPGPYKLPAYSGRGTVVYTNRVPVTPHRGAGRPQAVFVMERVMDCIADRCGIDRSIVRERNYIQPEAMPYAVGLIFRDGSPMVYDSGDYPECQRVALEAIGYADFPAERTAARARGKHVGIGIAAYVEGTGLGPHESARIKVDSAGNVRIVSGAASQGQGHETTFAQVAADELGIPFRCITVTTGDTTVIPYGIGAFASRLGALGNSAVKLAAADLRGRIVRAAAALLATDVDDIELIDGCVRSKRAPERAMTLGDLSIQAGGAFPGSTLPRALTDVGLETTAYFMPKQSTYSSGVAAVKVEVDVRTGVVTILDFVLAHDCGRVINPLIVEGQVQGAVACGVGGALYERIVYDDQGQLTSGSFVDYLLPTTMETPSSRIFHVEAPTPLNPLGAKGAGEGGTIPAPAAIIAAIEHAVGDDFRIRHFPLGPEDVRAIAAATA